MDSHIVYKDEDIKEYIPRFCDSYLRIDLNDKMHNYAFFYFTNLIFDDNVSCLDELISWYEDNKNFIGTSLRMELKLFKHDSKHTPVCICSQISRERIMQVRTLNIDIIRQTINAMLHEMVYALLK